MSNEIRAQLQALLNSGDLASPVTYLGSPLTKNGAGSTPQTIDFCADGWERNPTSDIGGRRSRGVEALRKSLLDRGKTYLASLLPIYHVFRQEQAPETIFNFSLPDPTRYNFPSQAFIDDAGLSMDQLWQIRENCIAGNNFLFVLTMSGGIEGIRTQYRGTDPTPSTGAYTTNFKPGVDPKAIRPTGLSGRKWSFDKILDIDGNPLPDRWTSHEIRSGTPDHFTYDLWFDTQTDENVTRLWQGWVNHVIANNLA